MDMEFTCKEDSHQREQSDQRWYQRRPRGWGVRGGLLEGVAAQRGDREDDRGVEVALGCRDSLISGPGLGGMMALFAMDGAGQEVCAGGLYGMVWGGRELQVCDIWIALAIMAA